MKCKCPPGYPKRIQRDFGSEARSRASLWSLPLPTFEVKAHTGECSLSDEVLSPVLPSFFR